MGKIIRLNYISKPSNRYYHVMNPVGRYGLDVLNTRLTSKNHRGKINPYLEEGPVAQLGARFNRTEEAEGSNPSRSTAEYGKSFKK